MIQKNPDAVLQWLRDIINASDNHLYGTTYDEHNKHKPHCCNKNTQANHTKQFTTAYNLKLLVFLTINYKSTTDNMLTYLLFISTRAYNTNIYH